MDSIAHKPLLVLIIIHILLSRLSYFILYLPLCLSLSLSVYFFPLRSSDSETFFFVSLLPLLLNSMY